MTASSNSFSGNPALQSSFWLAVWSYGLFLFSSWSMAGMEASVVVLHLLAIYCRIRYPVAVWLPRWVWLPFVAFAASAIVSSLLANDPLASLDYLRGDYRLFLPLILAMALAHVDLRRLLLMHVAVASLMAVYGLEQSIWGVHLLRAQVHSPGFASGAFGLYLTYAGIMLMAAPVFASLAGASVGRERWYWIGGAVLCSVATVVSLSRAGWLGLVTGLLVLSLQLPRRRAIVVLTAAVVMLGTLGVLISSGTLRKSLPREYRGSLVDRLLTLEQRRADPRVHLWNAALRGMRDAPVLGHGFAEEVFDRYRDEILRARKKNKQRFSVAYRPHNVYLEMALATGLVGLALFLAIWAAVMAWCVVWIRRAGPHLRFEKAVLWGVFAALSGSLVHGWFGGHFQDAEVQINILMWMGLALHVGLRVQARLAEAGAATARD